MNNTIHWAAVEDVLALAGRLPASAELEYHRAVLPGHQPRLATSQADGQLWLWLLDGAQRLASARLTFSGQPGLDPHASMARESRLAPASTAGPGGPRRDPEVT